MDTGTGDLRYLNGFESIKGKLVEWKVGEEVVIKDCKFRVKEIKLYPHNEIVLKGMPNKPEIEKLKDTFKELPDDVKEPSQIMKDFIKKKGKKKK